jgi:hypothetical protein
MTSGSRRDLDALLLSKPNKKNTENEKKIESTATMVSNEYHLKDTIQICMSITSGFYDVIGFPKDQPLPELTPLLRSSISSYVSNYIYPVLIVDFARDSNLTKIKKSALSLCTPIPSLEIRARVLATLVCNFMGGSQLVAPRCSIRELEPKVRIKEEQQQIEEILLGQVTHGGCRERALLYKFLCDMLNLPCQLIRRISQDYKEVIVWNEVVFGDQRYVVDLLHNASSLYKISSNEAQAYCGISFVDSLADYPFQVSDLDKQEEKGAQFLCC